MYEVITTGGIEYMVQAFNAVAGWTGGGGYQSFLRVVMMVGFMYAIIIVTFNLEIKTLMNWFLGTLLIYGCLMVPTTSVRIVDTTNPAYGARVVGNVPLGLALMASTTSQIGDWMTGTAETLFAPPNGQQYRSNGILYGASMINQVNALDIDDPVFNENLTNYVQSCVMYDIYLNRKKLSDVTQSNDIMASIATTSVSLFVPIRKSLTANVEPTVTVCKDAYNDIKQQWAAFFQSRQAKIAKIFYPSLQNNLATAKVVNDLPLVYGALTQNSQDSQKIIQHAMVMNTFTAARNGGQGDSAIDAFTQARADVQTSNTYNSLGTAARKWVPIIGMILTVLFYSLFPIIFVLFLLPQTGYMTLKSYFVGFLYLASWGPIYAILNMFLVSRYSADMSAIATGGMTLSNRVGVQNVTNSTSELAGYLLASVPFLAAGITRGAMAIGSLSHSFLAPAQSAAGAAAADKTLGNYSGGNLNWQNLQANNASTFQQQLAPAMTTGSGVFRNINADGSTNSVYSGREVFDNKPGISSYFTSITSSFGAGQSATLSAAATRTEGRELRALQSTLASTSRSLSSSTGGGTTTSRGTQSSNTNISAGGRRVSEGVTVTDAKGNVISKGEDERTGSEFRDSGRTHVGAEAYLEGKVGTPLGGIVGSEVKVGAKASTGYTRSWDDADIESKGKFESDVDNESYNRAETDDNQKYSDRGFRNEDGTFKRVSNDEFSSWSSEKRDAYTQSLSNEISKNEALAKKYDEAASFYNSASTDVVTNLNRDFEDYVTSNPDYSGFGANGRDLLMKSPGQRSVAETAAFNQALQGFYKQEVDKHIAEFNDAKEHIDDSYNAQSGSFALPSSVPSDFARGGGVNGPGGFSQIADDLGSTPYNSARGGGINTRFVPGPGTRSYEPSKDQYGTPGMVAGIDELGLRMQARGYSPVNVGDLSKQGGGPMAGHDGHQTGRNVDLRPMRKDGKNLPTSINETTYDYEATRAMVMEMRRIDPDAKIFFNDKRLIAEGLTSWLEDHDNHLHWQR
ncbi:MAG: hypothetical protein HC843_04565 [Sphingomonadales bacterium]|nr:hypothetical protein [Sphingomonadales bacterium]